MSLDAASFQLAIRDVIGTSARTANQFAIQDNLIAYTASGGVAVCLLDETGKVESQRFFCANSTTNDNGANAYLNMVHEEPDHQKDSFGFNIHEPLVVTGSGLSNVYDVEGSSPVVDGDSWSPSKLKDRVRSISCLAISPNKKYLAIGESGYQPRILLFSLAPDLTKKPFALIYEHSFGINSITFSGDLRHFCSLGLINDGFINVWKVSSTSIHLLASNRCTTIINQVLWHENYIVTLGLRFIKVWKYDDDDKVVQKPLALKGKNVLLGPFINLCFNNASIFNSDEILITTTTNQLLLLKLSHDLKLVYLIAPSYPLNNIIVDYEKQVIWIESTNHTIHSMEFSQLKPSDVPFAIKAPPSKITGTFGTPTKENKAFKLAKMYNFDSHQLVYLNDDEEIVLYNKASASTKTIIGSLIKNLAGFKTCFLQDLIVYSLQGKIRVVDGASVNLRTLIDFELPSNGLVSNALTAIDFNGENLFLGDKLGNIYIMEVVNNTILFQTKAHSSSINDIVYYEVGDFQLITSISRDRMIQFFYKSKDTDWNILQTIPIHNGNLLKVQYVDHRIYVCSTDRSISIHRIKVEDNSIKVFQEKIISNKSTPINFKVHNEELIVSMNDKSLLVYKVNENYELSRHLKLVNEKINENLLVENFLIYKNFIIASSSDKSLRVFNFSNGRPVSVAWGHLDTILSLNMNAQGELLSIGSDGCIFKWAIGEEEVAGVKLDSPQSPVIDTLPMYTKVTRKIIPTSPLKPVKAIPPDEVNEAPQSTAPTPKLTSATLKRLESKRNSIGSRPSSPTRSSITRKPVLPPSPFKSGPPSRSASPVRSPTRKTIDRPHVPLDQSPTPKPKTDPLRKALSHLDSLEQIIREGVSKSEQQQLHNKIANVLKLLDNVPPSMQQLSIQDPTDNLLESYSDKLMQLFEKKLEARSKFPQLHMDPNVTTFFDKKLDANDID